MSRIGVIVSWLIDLPKRAPVAKALTNPRTAALVGTFLACAQDSHFRSSPNATYLDDIRLLVVIDQWDVHGGRRVFYSQYEAVHHPAAELPLVTTDTRDLLDVIYTDGHALFSIEEIDERLNRWMPAGQRDIENRRGFIIQVHVIVLSCVAVHGFESCPNLHR
jgi:hypothetical protein